MTNQMREHLKQIEAAIQNTKPIMEKHAADYNMQDKRTLMVLCFISQMFEHHEATLVLLMQDQIGSAFSLARSVVEGVYRGLWINSGATDEEVERFARKDEIGLGMTGLALANDNTYRLGKNGDFFQDFKKRSWDALNSYAHTGMMQLARRFSEHEFKPDYTEKQVVQITTALTTLILMLAIYFLTVQGQKFLASAEAIGELARGYGPLADSSPFPKSEKAES
jgi:hypothetical protein